MLYAINPNLVLQWACPHCKQINYHSGCNSAEAREAKAECAKEMGVDVDSLGVLPDKLFCVKCEEQCLLPDGDVGF